MTTDFTYNNKTIDITGPAKPSGVNQPLDPRTEVKIYADIKSIPNPYVGMIITVLEDETNSNKMTDYKVLSLKANSLGIANSVVDQVQRYVDYLGANGQGVDTNDFATKEELGLKADKTELHSHINKTVLDGITSTNVDNWNNKVDKVEGKGLSTNDYTTEEKTTLSNLKATVGDTNSGLVKDVKDLKENGISQDNINTAIENYLTEHPVQSGATTEQANQIEANKTAIGDENSGLTKEINDINNALTRVDAVTLNGKKFSNPMTKDEYDAMMNKDPNTIYLVNDEQVINSVPDYSTSDANKVLAVNSTGTALAWVDAPSGSGTGITAAQAAQIQANKTAIQTINETIGNKNELPVGDANIIASINRIDSKTSTGGTGLTSEQEAKLNSIDNKVDKINGKGLSTNDYTTEEKATLSNLKTTVGDTNSGLVKDVKDLKTNGVSQDNINTAVENYLTEHPVASGATTEQANQIEANKTAINKLTPLNFTNLNVTKIITANVDENIVKQEYLGGYIEIQPDSWDGTNCYTDDSTETWGFPYSLLPSEQARIKKEIFPGNGKGIMYIRFPLGFAYRGYRNIDETSRLAKNIGPRWKGQNASLKLWFEDIAKAGGGLAPEYWCPAPHWLTGGAYYNSAVNNQICAGGSYDRTTTLASIKTSDSVQYNAQIEAFTDAIIDDLEYLHKNIAPVRMFGLQNEPIYGTQPYGACKYDKQTYNDVLQILVPKIRASAVLSEYNDEPNEVKILVASSDEKIPFDGAASTYIANNSSDIWGYTHHLMTKASGEAEFAPGKRGAEWYKSSEYSSKVKGNRTNVFCNEYEYFSSGFTGDTDDFRCSNNMLHLISELVYGEAKVLHPVIHVCKPIGHKHSGSNTKGYSMFAVNLKNEYGMDITNPNNTEKLLKGTYCTNSTMYNSWKMFNDNLPINSYVVGDYSSTVEHGGYVTLKHGGKLYIFLANNGSEDIKISLTFSKEKYFKGKFYDNLHVGDKILDKSGSKIDFIIPAYSGQCWIEREEPVIGYMPISCEAISLSKSSLTLNTKQSQTLTATLTPSNTTDPVYWSIDKPSIASIINGVITPISDGTATVTATCGTKSATCAITVSLPTLQSISAVYNQGSTVIYPDSSLNNLKSGLTVTGTYSDNSTETISDYELSGTLTEGTSTITVTYNSLTTTFDVTVSQQAVLQSITATYTQGTQKVYEDTALTELKKNLVVKANYSDGNQLEITDYELSGTLTEGTSTITVTYNEKTTTFNVIVSAVSNIDYSEGYINDSGNLAYLTNTYVDNKYIDINSASSVIIYTTTGGISCFRVTEYDKNKNFIKRSYKASKKIPIATSDEFILDTNTKYIRIGFGMPEPVTEEMLNKLFGEYTINNEIAPNNLLYEEGGINSTTGLNEDSAEKYRTDYVELCCNYFSVDTGIVNSDLYCAIRFYDKEKNILSNVTSDLAQKSETFVVDNLKYIRLILVTRYGAKVTINENDAVLINGLKYILKKQ